MESARYSCNILTKIEFFDTFSKNPQISDIIQIHPVVDKLFHADRHTD
jgi:hypothetical protein